MTKLTAEEVDDIRDQCVAGLWADHDCPAIYALSAILAIVNKTDDDWRRCGFTEESPPERGRPATKGRIL